MRMSLSYVWLSVLDLIAFVGFWSVVTVKQSVHHGVSVGLEIGYWMTAIAGLTLAVFGFVVLTRSRGGHVVRPVLCVLLAMSPACAALIGILSHLGGQPVGR